MDLMAHAPLAELPSATWVDETLLAEAERIVAIRFGRARDPLCQIADTQLAEAVGRLSALCGYTVDIDKARRTATLVAPPAPSHRATPPPAGARLHRHVRAL